MSTTAPPRRMPAPRPAGALPTLLRSAAPVPSEMLLGPGRTWAAEARWAQVEVLLDGQWLPARVERWHLRQGDLRWMAQIRWAPDADAHAWVFYEPSAVRQALARPGQPPR
ncbi:hypothetical protein [Kitasatospora sp. NPDC089509]|uniref:hypothetical protein n=1 Tax=Kitasatospora sp. NPDC089509 TaxID=3364079 RepID=UPI0038062D45